jgi:hypothetical protein
MDDRPNSAMETVNGALTADLTADAARFEPQEGPV